MEETPKSGRNVDFSNEYAEMESQSSFPEKIERDDLKSHPIERGGTEIVLQRHGKYIRDPEDPNTGSLTPEAQQAEKEAAETYFKTLIESIPAEERDTLKIMVVASDTQYRGGGRRSYETADIVQKVAIDSLAENKIPAENVINISHDLKGDGGPRPMPQIREPQMFDKSPDFVKFLTEKYGDLGLDFWIAFEEDKEIETRQSMGAEGPDEIADRMAFSVRALARYAENYHRTNPDSRLVVWAATHYDTISPFVKREVFGVGKDKALMVDYGAGIAVDIDPSGKATTEIAGKQYEVPIKKET